LDAFPGPDAASEPPSNPWAEYGPTSGTSSPEPHAPAHAWGSFFGSSTSGTSEIDTAFQKLRTTPAEAPAPDLPPDPRLEGTGWDSAEPPAPEPAPRHSFESDPPLPDIKQVVPLVAPPPEAERELVPPGWASPVQIPMPDSIFRDPDPPPVPSPDVEEEESGVIDDARATFDANQQSATRDRKALTIVLSLAVVMIGIVAVALLVILL